MGYYTDIARKINSASNKKEIKEVFEQVEKQSPSIQKAAEKNRESSKREEEEERKKRTSIPRLIDLNADPVHSQLEALNPRGYKLPLSTAQSPALDLESIARSLGYGTEKTLAGAAGAVEDTFRFVSGYGNKLLSGVTSLGGLADNPVSDFLSQTAENTLSGSYVDRWRQSIDERYQPTAFQQKLGGLNEAAGAMLPSIAASFATGGLSNAAAIGKGASMTAAGAKAAQDLSRGVGLASMFPQVAGASTRQAMNEGAGVDRALTYGALSGALEAGTESLFAGIPGIKGGRVSQAVQNILSKATKSPAVSKAADILGEGVEEVISGYVSPYLQRMTYNEQAELASSDELLESFISGVALSGIMQGGAGIAGRIASRSVGQSLDVNALGENSRKNYIAQMERDGGTTRGFQEQWKQYNDAGNAGIPFAQVPGEPTAIGMSRAYAAHAAGLNDYQARMKKSAPEGTQYKFADHPVPTREQLEQKPDMKVVDIRGRRQGRLSEQRKQFLASKQARRLYEQPVINRDTGEPVFITPATMTHTFSNPGADQIGVAEHIGEIIENAVLTHAEPITHGNQSTTGIYTLFGAVQTERGVQPVKIKVKEYDYKGQYLPKTIKDYFIRNGQQDEFASAYDGRVLMLESIEKEDASSSVATMPETSSGVNHPSASSSTVSIAELLGLVNDEGARKYIPAAETSAPRTPGLIQNGYTSSVSENTAKSIDSIAKKAGVTVEIADDVPAAGEYRDGVIRIHANAENPVRQVFVHELTHHLEQSDGYGELVDFYRANTEKSGVRLADLVRAKQEQYAEQGIQLTEDAAQREIIAEFCDTTLFTDERSIMRLAQEKRSLVQKIRDWLHEMRVRLRGTQQEKFVLDAEKRYQKALDSVDGQKKNVSGETQYKIETLPGGKQYVKADRPVIQGNDPKQWSRQAEQFINEKIRGGEDITVFTPDGFAVQITDRSAYKLTDTHVQRIQKVDRGELPTEALGAKMRAAGHIDELIETARWKNWQADKNGSHANDIGEQGFDYFTTYFEDENGDYYRVTFSAGVNDGMGRYVNDDMDTAYSIGIMDKRKHLPRTGSSASPTGSGAQNGQMLSDTSISPSAQNSNPEGQNNSGKPNQFKVDGSNYYDLLRKAGYIEQADALQRAAGQYGTINRGEMPARDVQLPAQMDENTRVRRFARTAAESSILTDEQAGEIGKAVAEGRFNYEPIPNNAARSHAENILARGDSYAQDAWDRAVNNNRPASKNDIAVGEYLLKQAAESGDTQRVVELTAQIAAEGTRAGQIVQAMSMLKRLDGVGQSIALDAMLKKMQGDLDRGKSGVFLKVPDHLREELVKAKGQEQVDKAMDKIYDSLAQQIPTKWSDKWNAWRYLAMLGNPRTHIRNVLGNAFFAPVVGTKNIVGAVIESGVYNAQRLAGKRGIERTKTVRGTIPLSGGKARSFAVDDFDKVQDVIKGGGKMNPSDIIREKQRVFKFKPLESLRKLNFNALEAEDGIFLKQNYVRSMVQYLQANKIDLDTFNPDGSQRDAAALQRARDYAIKEAQKATYRDFSRAAQAISNASRNAGGAANILIEGVLPFKKTPINVLKRGIEYSPAGLLQAITTGTNQLRKGEISANEFIDHLSAGMTGTGISLLGMLLFRSGLLVGGSGDDKEAEFRDSLGAQSYAIRLEDKTYTIDWLAPASMPLFVGAEIQSLADTFDGLDGRVVYDSILNLAEPMTKMSMLDGLNTSISSVRYGEDPLSDMAANAVIGYIGQAVPTLFGQIARTLDDTARTTYIEKNGSLPDSVQRALQKNRNKIPGLSNQSIAYRDVFGRAEKDTSMISRALKNFISPGYFSEEKIGSMESELIRVYQNTDDSGVLPSMPAKYFNVNGERKDLTAEEYEKFSYTRGSIMYSNLSELTETSLYKNLDDTDKASAISNVIELSNALAKTEVSDYQLEGWMADAKGAFDKGIKIPDFILIRDGASQIDSFKDEEGKTVTNSPSVRKAYYLLTETNLTPSQRCYMYEVLNVGKKVQKMSPDKVKAEYQKMYNRYGR